MQFILTDLQKEIKENAEKLLSEQIDLLDTIKKVDEDVRLDSDLWKLVNEQGWLALDVTEDDGGLGFSTVDASILSEVAGYYLPIIPLFSSGGRGASTQRAKINLEKAKDDLTETEQKLKLQIASAKSEYQFAIEDHENKKQNLKLAERIESKNETKFFEGIASSFDLRQAQLQLYNAQQEYLQAMFDVITKKTELETILNTPSY